MKRSILIVLLWGGMAGGAAARQEPGRLPDASSLGVYEAIEVARASSPALNRAHQQLAAVQGAWWTSFGLAPPELVYAREGIPTGAGGGYLEQRWVLTQSVDFPLLSYYRLRRIDAERQVAVRQLEAETRLVKAAVKKAYADLAYTLEIVHLRREEVRLAGDLQQAVLTRIEVGETAVLDLMKAELQQVEAQANLDEALRQFQLARYTLFNTIGLDPEQQRYEIRFPDTLAYFEVDIRQETVLAALEGHPTLRSAEAGLQAAREGVRQARSMILPSLQLGLYSQNYGQGYDFFGFEVGFKVPLWFFLDQRGQVQQARAVEQERFWQQQGTYLDLKKEIEQAWHSYETSEATLQRFYEVSLVRSAELLRLTQEGYRIGELDLLTLLDTQRTYLSSQKRYYDALRDYYFHLIDLEKYLDRDIVFQPPAAQAQGASFNQNR